MNFEKHIILIFFLCFNTLLFAQYQITIEGVMLDKETNQPIPYVNISFGNKNLKTISDTNGQFTIQYDDAIIGENDIIQFTKLGYELEEAKASQFYKLLLNTNKIYLSPKNKIVTQKEETIQNSNIYGKVYAVFGPLQGATIKLKNTFTEVQTDVEGNYRINAKVNDVLQVYFLEMKPKEILINGVNNINIQLESDGELLKEVVVKGESKKEELIDLGLSGKKSFDAIGTSINIVTAKDIAPQYNNLSDLLSGKFAGVHIEQGVDEIHAPEVWLRGGKQSILNPASAIYDIDGVVYSENAPFIDPQNIETLVILKSLASTNKYGSAGRGGVIVIKTKMYSGTKVSKSIDSALVKGNEYTEVIPFMNSVGKAPLYILELEKATSYNEALTIYKQQKENIQQFGIPFYIETSQYFMRWDKAFAHTILTDILDVGYNNSKALTTLAYRLEELEKLEEAKQVYQRIAELRPKDAQSYFDLARIYESTGYYTEAMSLFKQMLSNAIEGVDFSGLLTPIKNELLRLVTVHKTNINFKGVPSDLQRADFKYDIRIVFEWNDPYAEFELQFVNPQKKFFKWLHTKFENKERMLNEIKKGYHTEEFIIDDAEKGEWVINIENLGEEPILNPTYLKYTVYKNFGLSNETKYVKLINLYHQKEKVTLDTFLYESGL